LKLLLVKIRTTSVFTSCCCIYCSCESETNNF